MESTKISRPWPDAPALAMRGFATGYCVEPNGEVVLGLVGHGAMVVRRGRERHTVRAGETCAWDASQAHAGTPYRCDAWDARVIVLEAAAIAAHHELVPAGFVLPRPVSRDPARAAQFVRLHRVLRSSSALRLAKETALDEYLGALLLAPPSPSRERARNDLGLRRACELLAARVTETVALDDLASVARASRFRVLRLFRAAFGMPPHRLQLAQRIALVRRMLEHGHAPSAIAAATGFADQSHMHRHFTRTLGITPSAYARAIRS
jgi:AraC-like DNA-binding protein